MSLVHPFHPQKLLWHSDRIALMQSGQPTPAPISLEWDVSNICSHQCPFCSFGTKESHGYRQQHWQHFPFDRAMTLIPELVLAGVRSVTLTGGGEPLMHPKVSTIMAELSAHGMPWGLVTNGAALHGPAHDLIAQYARFVRVSLDAGTESSHQAMHRPAQPEFHRIIENMRLLVRDSAVSDRQIPLMVGASFCVTDQNYREIGIAAQLVKQLGGNYLEVRPTYPTDWRGDGWTNALTNVSAAIESLQDARLSCDGDGFQIVGMIDRFEALSKSPHDYDKCQIGPLTSVLGADGRLWHCCVQRGQTGFDLGNVLHAPFKDVWSQAQAKHIENVIDVKKCPKCRYANYNKILQGLQQDALHVAFV